MNSFLVPFYFSTRAGNTDSMHSKCSIECTKPKFPPTPDWNRSSLADWPPKLTSENKSAVPSKENIFLQNVGNSVPDYFRPCLYRILRPLCKGCVLQLYKWAILNQVWCEHLLIPGLKRQRQADLCESKASMFSTEIVPDKPGLHSDLKIIIFIIIFMSDWVSQHLGDWNKRQTVLGHPVYRTRPV